MCSGLILVQNLALEQTGVDWWMFADWRSLGTVCAPEAFYCVACHDSFRHELQHIDFADNVGVHAFLPRKKNAELVLDLRLFCAGHPAEFCAGSEMTRVPE